uniref:Uncharacterized protein n=1 Tax=Anopheles coluzzii TaxID=1518534 RepID=A0A8W7PIY1_ANOCL
MPASCIRHGWDVRNYRHSNRRWKQLGQLAEVISAVLRITLHNFGQWSVRISFDEFRQGRGEEFVHYFVDEEEHAHVLTRSKRTSLLDAPNEEQCSVGSDSSLSPRQPYATGFFGTCCFSCAIRSASRVRASFLIASRWAVFMRVASILLLNASTAWRNCSSRSLVRALSFASAAKSTVRGAFGMVTLFGAAACSSASEQTAATSSSNSTGTAFIVVAVEGLIALRNGANEKTMQREVKA